MSYCGIRWVRMDGSVGLRPTVTDALEYIEKELAQTKYYPTHDSRLAKLPRVRRFLKLTEHQHIPDPIAENEDIEIND